MPPCSRGTREAMCCVLHAGERWERKNRRLPGGPQVEGGKKEKEEVGRRPSWAKRGRWAWAADWEKIRKGPKQQKDFSALFLK